EEPVVRVAVAAVALRRRAAEHPRFVRTRADVAALAVELQVAAGECQAGVRVLLDGELVRQEVRARVARNASRRGQPVAVELPAVRIAVAGAAVVGPAPGMAFGERSAGDVALPARGVVVRRGEREPRVCVLL